MILEIEILQNFIRNFNCNLIDFAQNNSKRYAYFALAKISLKVHHFRALISAEISAETFGKVAEISVSAETGKYCFGRTLVSILISCKI